jgi:deaminated glutathione amidase
MNNNFLNVAAIQMVSGLNWQDNLDQAELLIRDAAHNGANLAVLPEFFIRIAESRDEEFNNITEELGCGKIQERLQNIARKYKIYLVAGTLPIKTSKSEDKCYNTTLVYNESGELVCHYHKIHLFKFENNRLKFNEGNTFNSGNEIITFKLKGFTIGLAICYDLRFPEMFRKMHNVDAIILPAAFLYHTGQDHWEVLLRARAIENQCYVIAAGQGGVHENGRHTFGHSMIINPWGKIIAVLKNGIGIVSETINKEFIAEIRMQLPALDNRKLVDK